MQKFDSVDEYIASFPDDTAHVLQQVRQIIREYAPEAEELISYNMPAYRFNGVLVYFAGYKNHIGFYGLPSGNAAIEEELSAYKQGRGSVQFPLSQPIPVDLIKKIVACRIQENLSKKKKS